MKLKQCSSSSSLNLVFLLISAVLVPSFTMAAQVWFQDTYHETTDCTGKVAFTMPITVSDICFKYDNTVNNSHALFTCSPLTFRLFPTPDCSGDPSHAQFFEGCKRLTGTTNSATVNCQTVPDNHVALIYTGTNCGDEGENMSNNNNNNLRFNRATVLDFCSRASDDETSFKLTVAKEEEDLLSLTTYSKSATCEGEPHETTMIKPGKCQKVSGIIVGQSDNDEGEADDVFVRIEPAVKGIRLSNHATKMDGGASSMLLLLLIAAMIFW